MAIDHHRQCWMRGRWRGTLCLAVVVLWVSATPGVPAQSGLAPHLTFAEASIQETRFDDFDLTLTGRDVRLRLTIEGRPVCLGRTTLLEYGFFFDKDQNATTGATDPLFAPLGIDARLSARCNPQTGLFESRGANVEVTNDGTNHVVYVDLTTTVDRLPSARFNWIAYVVDGTTLVRFPDVGDYAGWRVFEATVF